MDFVSHCPSLVDIFCFVDFHDILNSKLVNRTFFHCIKGNSRRIPRRSISLNISLCQEPMCVSIECRDKKREDLVFLTDETIIIVSCTKFIGDYYKENAKPQRMISGSEEDDKIKAILNFYSDEKQANCLLYKNASKKDGLRTILSILFRRYYFKSIVLEEETTAFGKVICDEFRRSSSYCDHLYASLPVILSDRRVDERTDMKALTNLVKTLDSNIIALKADYAIGVHVNEIKEAIRWNKCVFLELYFEGLAESSVILQNWESGHFSLNKVQLTSKAYLYPTGPTQWYNDNLDPILENLEQATRVHEENSANVNFKRIFRIARRCDGKTLTLTHMHEKEYTVYRRSISITE